MAIIEFGEWLPDQPDLGNPGVTVATNVLPAARGYLPMQDLAVITDAIDSKAFGAKMGVDDQGNIFHYAGDAGKIYQNVDEVWTDRSKSGGYSTAAEERWEFAQWKNTMIGVNFSDNPQQITFGGSNFSDLTTDLQARHVTVIRGFVVMANTNDSTDGQVPHRVRWSAIDDATDWTVSASTLSDFQDLYTSSVEKVVGGEFGVVFQRDSVWRMTFVGSPTVFQFDEILPGIGAISSGAVVQVGKDVYFMSQRGFYVVRNGTTAERIGADKVDEFVLNDVDNDYLKNITATSDDKRVYWSYPSANNSGGTPDKILVFDRTLSRWSIIDKEVELIWQSAGAAFSLEDLDNITTNLDNLSLSLDSDAWKGGKRTKLAAFDTAHKNGFWDSVTTLEAELTTRELELTPGRNTHLNAFRHVIDGGTVTAKVGTRDSQSDSISFGASLSERSTNRFTARTNSRYHQFQFNITGGFNHAIGMQVDQEDIARGGRRGK